MWDESEYCVSHPRKYKGVQCSYRTYARKYKQCCTLNNITMEIYDIIHSTSRHN